MENKTIIFYVMLTKENYFKAKLLERSKFKSCLKGKHFHVFYADVNFKQAPDIIKVLEDNNIKYTREILGE